MTHHWRWGATGVALWWVGAFLFELTTLELINDHYWRLSAARQIAAYGELPFRDFLDAGLFMEEIASAVLLRLSGGSLLGELLLVTSFIASGCAIVLLLGTRASGSRVVGSIAAAFVLVSLPRGYDYDKCLFFPLGILLCWRYADRSTPGRVWALAVGLVAGALFRYDTGLYIFSAALVTMLVVHASEWRTMLRRLAFLTGAMACLSLPYLAYLHFYGGIIEATTQIAAYARHESARTGVLRLPRFSFDEVVLPGSFIRVRWASSVDDSVRAEQERRFGLQQGEREHSADKRTWSYRIDPPSSSTLRALVTDPRVEDTDGIDRVNFALPREPFWTRMGRRLPTPLVRVLPGPWNEANANAFLYYFLKAIPLVSVLVLLWGLRSAMPIPTGELGRIGGVVAMAAVLNVFVLRDPIAARVGGMAAAHVVLLAWVAHRAWHIKAAGWRRVFVGALAATLVLAAWSLSVAEDWSREVELLGPKRMRQTIRLLSSSPPSLDLLPAGRLEGLVRYLNECTVPTDRLFATGFVPELFFFSQRGFIGAPAIYEGHWSGPRFERMTIASLESHSVPIAVIETERYERFRADYPILDRYLSARYERAGEAGGGLYTILVDRSRRPSRTSPQWSLPCFAG